MSWGFEYREYVPVAQKKAQGRAYARRVAKKQKRDVQPVLIQGNKIAKTFWGKGWCDHLESFSDFANRLPRGRTYVRNGSVVDLQISSGCVEAIVAGSDPYDVTVQIARLKPVRWKTIRSDCAGSIDSLLDLLSGRLSNGVMQRLTDRSRGLFPAPDEIDMACSCPDWATVCKHVAAVLYGVGAQLDTSPELLFLLRGVDHHELVSDAVSAGSLTTAFGAPSNEFAGEDLGALFGIELDGKANARPGKRSSKKKRSSAKKSIRKRAAQPKSAPKKAVQATAATAKRKSQATKTVNKKVTTKASAKKRTGGKTSIKKQVNSKNGVQKRPLKKKARKK